MFWSLAGSPFSVGYQQAEDTPTPTVEDTDTPTTLPTLDATETGTPTATDTQFAATAVPPTPTAAPTSTKKPRSAAAPLVEVQLSGEYSPDEVLVRFRRKAGADAIHGCLHAAGASIESEIEELSVLVVKVPEGGVGKAIARLKGCPDLRMAEPNYLAHAADTIPSDPDWSLQYGLVRIRAPQGWSLSTGSPAVTIAIVDTGVALGHPDLSAKIVSGHDFVNNDAVAQDDNGHGTHVAGIAAASTNNGTGVAGVSWGALIMPVKVLDSAGNGTFANVAAGITWAADNGAQVINLSLGGNSSSIVLESAVDYAAAKGVVLVAAAGNTGANSVLYPARYPNVIAVAATDSSNGRASFSNFGPQVDVAAPGVAILSTLPGGYGYESGTSMSTPFVSGLAAILRGVAANGSPDSIAWYMEHTALDLGAAGADPLYGYGLIQMDAAIRLALRPNPSPTSASVLQSGQGAGNFAPYQPVPGAPTPTFTPSPSPTPSPTPSSTATSTLSASTPTGTADAGVLSSQAASLSLPQQLTARFGTDWPLGCGGGLLVLAGLWQVWAMSRRSSRRAGRPYFKTR